MSWLDVGPISKISHYVHKYSKIGNKSQIQTLLHALQMWDAQPVSGFRFRETKFTFKGVFMLLGKFRVQIWKLSEWGILEVRGRKSTPTGRKWNQTPNMIYAMSPCLSSVWCLLTLGPWLCGLQVWEQMDPTSVPAWSPLQPHSSVLPKPQFSAYPGALPNCSF